MSTDIAIGPVGLPNVGGFIKKPPHLIELTEGKTKINFFSFDRPDFHNDYIQVRGCVISPSEVESLSKDLASFMNAIPKDSVVECLYPTHRVLSIKNLYFKAK
jgi:hypothetical protein